MDGFSRDWGVAAMDAQVCEGCGRVLLRGVVSGLCLKCRRKRDRAGWTVCTIWQYEHPGEDGGIWYAASYPLGATRYYRTREARATAVEAYANAIRKTGGHLIIADTATGIGG